MVPTAVAGDWLGIHDCQQRWLLWLSNRQRFWLDCNLGQPEVENFGVSPLGDKMFAGLISTMNNATSVAPRSSASATSIDTVSKRLNVLTVVPRCGARVMPSRNSITMKVWPSCSSNFVNGADVGMVQAEAAWLHGESGLGPEHLLATSSGRNFSATKPIEVWVSSALYTTPIPPPPSFSEDAIVRDGLADHMSLLTSVRSLRRTPYLRIR